MLYHQADETTYVNYNGDPLHNVVRAKGSLSLNGVDLANPVNNSLTAANLCQSILRL
jgi:hypothetical protein